MEHVLDGKRSYLAIVIFIVASLSPTKNMFGALLRTGASSANFSICRRSVGAAVGGRAANISIGCEVGGLLFASAGYRPPSVSSGRVCQDC